MHKFYKLGAGVLILVLALSYLYFELPRQNSQAGGTKDSYLVRNVVDGDTIEIERHGQLEKVRLIGIDTPETLDPRKPVQCFGKEASDFSKSLMAGKSVRLEFDPLVGERDKYNRLLAYVWLQDGSMINNLLVKNGYAHEYTYRSQSYKFQSQFKQAEQSAKIAELGFWSDQTCGGKVK